MKIVRCHIEGLAVLEPDLFRDTRGYFTETYSQERFCKEVAPVKFIQDNESCSQYGVLRGLHFQISPHAQDKLVRVVRGSVLDVAVDLRKTSATFGKYFSIELNEENKKIFFIPAGFAHGFVTLSREALFQYKCSRYYAPESEASLLWNDPLIGIDWKIPCMDIILSEKDKQARLLSELYKVI